MTQKAALRFQRVLSVFREKKKIVVSEFLMTKRGIHIPR